MIPQTTFQMTPQRRQAAQRIHDRQPRLVADVRAAARNRDQSMIQMLNDWTANNPSNPHSGYGSSGGSAADRRLICELLASQQ